MSQDNVVDILIVTALEKERDAVLLHLESPQEVKMNRRTAHKAYLQHKNFETGYQVVVLCFGGMGNTRSATFVTQAIQEWNPRAVILVGIIAGTQPEKQSLGDLVIPKQIIGYELGKKQDTGTKTRYESHRASTLLIDKTNNFQLAQWFHDSKIIPRPDGTTGRIISKVHYGVVASGEKVISDSKTIKELRIEWDDLMGVEMEGFGTVFAVFENDPNIEMLMVKGICDWADPNKNNMWQDYAASISAAYVVNFLKSKPIECLEKSRVQPKVIPTKVVSNLSGPVKIQLCQRLGDDWSDLADYLDIPVYDRRRFTKGRECQDVLEWLRERDRLHSLAGALEVIERPDLVNLL